jgi:hypothetical protein
MDAGRKDRRPLAPGGLKSTTTHELVSVWQSRVEATGIGVEHLFCSPGKRGLISTPISPQFHPNFRI